LFAGTLHVSHHTTAHATRKCAHITRHHSCPSPARSACGCALSRLGPKGTIASRCRTHKFSRSLSQSAHLPPSDLTRSHTWSRQACPKLPPPPPHFSRTHAVPLPFFRHLIWGPRDERSGCPSVTTSGPAVVPHHLTLYNNWAPRYHWPPPPLGAPAARRLPHEPHPAHEPHSKRQRGPLRDRRPLG